MPSWKDLKRFCQKDGWELYKTTDHYFYRKVMPDGTLKRTKVSNGTGEIKKTSMARNIKKTTSS
ncbi:MAG: type II toxin-antitoxin system HicA family toxin [Desulfotomaculum sp.]|nr:type II toxin-antitoxin system HicA family toxin [Desulfotomaculum sp.]